ncbi:MAG TPA: arginine deiminase family protein [Actinomycetes bacterium]|nr:arginine deiminase family protein [Actinomycetes bacterium]
MVAQKSFGVRSMSEPLRRVLVVRPTTTGDFIAAGWRQPDTDALLREHDKLVELLDSLGVEVTVTQAPDGLVDACFAYDPVFVTGAGAIELRMAKPARQAEPAFLAAEVAHAGVPAIGRLEAPATADGGDLCWLDEATLAVGRSYRTNAAAHEQLSDILAREGVTIERADLPHHRGPAHVMHLMSVLSPVAPDLVVVFEPLAPVPLLQALADRGYRTVPADPDELADQGCNVLAIRPGVVVMPDTAPRTRAALERAGAEVHTYRAAEINKGDGGPTCLTRPLLRV